MMPVIKVWSLPKEQPEEALKALYEGILEATTDVKELGITKKDITCLFPSDLMSYGLGDEIIIEVEGLFEKPERTQTVCQTLAESLCEKVKSLYQKAKVECFVRTFNPDQGFCVLD